MLKIVYTPDGENISDFEVRNKVKEIANHQKENLTIKTTSENLINAFVLATIQDEILSDNIEFYAKDIRLAYDPCLGLSDNIYELQKKLDIEYCIFSNIVEEIIKAGYKNIMKKHQK